MRMHIYAWGAISSAFSRLGSHNAKIAVCNRLTAVLVTNPLPLSAVGIFGAFAKNISMLSHHHATWMK